MSLARADADAGFRYGQSGLRFTGAKFDGMESAPLIRSSQRKRGPSVFTEMWSLTLWIPAFAGMSGRTRRLYRRCPTRAGICQQIGLPILRNERYIRRVTDRVCTAPSGAFCKLR